MGLDGQLLRFLLESRRTGVCLDSVLMIGRQRYFLPSAQDLYKALLRGGVRVTEADAANVFQSGGGFIEPLLHLLGARTIESLDCSSHEHATIVHDLNRPVPEGLKGAFTCVLDGGTLEHVFNFPQAVRNCMEMVAVGGHFVGLTTANNFMGHGFYQFSPELYYRVFSEPNGFAVEDLILTENDPDAPWYRVADPEQFGGRVELVNRKRTYLLVRARRLCPAEIFRIPPQQSDYVALWHEAETGSTTERTKLLWLKRVLPEFIKRPLKRVIRGRPWPFQSNAFKKV